ncbi:MAG: hypothetical protein JW700_00645 [Candidatus Aenigmarchaeota archaeon]|nr:hypothetical protein [Candidatus Aenigmarchaeota archaeon]
MISSNKTQRAFNNLAKILDNNSKKSYTLPFAGENHTLYELENNVKIVREIRDFERPLSFKTSGYPFCKTTSVSMPDKFSVYYVFKDNKFLTGDEEIKKTIMDATGVCIPKIDSTIRGRGFGFVYRPIMDRVVGDFETDKKVKPVEDDYQSEIVEM